MINFFLLTMIFYSQIQAMVELIIFKNNNKIV